MHFSNELPSAVSVKQLTGKELDRDVLLQEIIVSIQDQFELIWSEKI